MTEHDFKIVLIGLGSCLHGDDVLGPTATRLVHERLPQVQIHTEGTGAVEAGDIVSAWTLADLAIVVDTSVGGAMAGQINRFDLTDRRLPPSMARSISRGGMLAEALALARASRLLPRQLLVYTIGSDAFSSGDQLSPAVACALPVLVQRIVDDIAELTPA